MAYPITSYAELRAHLKDAINIVLAGKRIIVQRRGKPVAALIGIEDLKDLEDIQSPGAASPACSPAKKPPERRQG